MEHNTNTAFETVTCFTEHCINNIVSENLLVRELKYISYIY